MPTFLKASRAALCAAALLARAAAGQAAPARGAVLIEAPAINSDLEDRERIDQLLAGAPGACKLVTDVTTHDEVTDLEASLDAIHRLDPTLNARESLHYWITLVPGSTRTPAALSFFSTQSSRVRSQVS